MTQREESLKEKTKHLEISNGKLVLVSEDLYNDFEEACRKVIEKIYDKNIEHPKVYERFLTID